MAPRPVTPCEGGCGCVLAPLGHGWYDTAPGPGDGTIPGWELQFVAEHSPDRCRVIRTFREAAENAATVTVTGDVVTGVGFVLASNERRLVVRAMRGEMWVDAAVDSAYLARASRDELDGFTTSMVEAMRHALGRKPRAAKGGPDPSPVIARDPAAASRAVRELQRGTAGPASPVTDHHVAAARTHDRSTP